MLCADSYYKRRRVRLVSNSQDRGDFHLKYKITFIWTMVYVGVDSGGHVSGAPNKLKQNRHLPPKRSSGQQILRNNASKPYLKTANISGDVRKTSDQFKWPWKTYEEWKWNQEQIENKIDQILKSGVKNVHANNRTKILNSKHRRFKSGSNSRKRNKRPDVKRSKRRRKKTLLKTLNKNLPTKSEPESNVSTGGAVLSVKYYSTEDAVTANVGKFETLVGGISPTTSVGDREILAREHLRMKSRWAAKHNRGVSGCSANNGGCEGLCVQSRLSHYCHCPEGFKLDTSRRKCIDLNECLSRNSHGPCQGECLNEWGSFKCGCDSVPGTQLDADGVTCVPIDRCAGTDCSHICINTRSGAFCSCPEGYVLDNDWTTCKEVLVNE